MPLIVSVSGMIVPMITTQVTIAAGLSTISARPTLKPDHISLPRSLIWGASVWAGVTGWLRAVRKP